MIKRIIYILGTWTLFIATKILFRVKTTGRNKIPQDEGILLVGRHTSYWDIPLMIVTAGINRPIVFIARDALLKSPFLRPFLTTYSVTIDRDHFSKDDFRKVLDVIKTDQIVGIYPEGTTRDTATIRSGVIRFAEKAGRDFLPFRIEADGPYPPDYPFGFPRLTTHVGSRVSIQELEEEIETGLGKAERYNALAEVLMQRIDTASSISTIQAGGET